MQFMDTHIHLQDFKTKDATDILKEAQKFAISHLIAVSAQEQDWESVQNYAQTLASKITPAFGIHPWYVQNLTSGWEKHLENLLIRYPHALIGECGFDRLRSSDYDRQAQIFDVQCQLAHDYHRSLLIHAVKASEWLENWWKKLPEGCVFHAFGGRMDMLKKALNCGSYIAVGWGIFKKRDADDILHAIPKHRLLFETDSPYMGKNRDEENSPCLIPEIAQRIANIRGDDYESLVHTVFQNSLKLIGQ